jgi:undecaprenyl-diphosphatase
MTPRLLARLDARDRALYTRWRLDDAGAGLDRLVWTALTHMGGATAMIPAALLPVLVGGVFAPVGSTAAWSVLLSHLIVQVMKRNLLRARPTERLDVDAHVAIPDKFSFPSGHSTGAMSVAFPYAVAFPEYAIPLLIFAAAVGFSRVRLGVHYPGDVVAGQAIAIGSGMLVLALQ